MGKAIIDYLILSVTFGSALLLLCYEDHAGIQDWPVAKWLSGTALFIKIPAFVTMLITVAIALTIYAWWSPIVIFIVGTIYGFLALQLLRHRVQFLAIAGILAGWVLCPVYIF